MLVVEKYLWSARSGPHHNPLGTGAASLKSARLQGRRNSLSNAFASVFTTMGNRGGNTVNMFELKLQARWLKARFRHIRLIQIGHGELRLSSCTEDLKHCADTLAPLLLAAEPELLRNK